MVTKKITPALVGIFFICHRQLWLMSRQLIPDQQNDILELARHLHETAYSRDKKEVVLDNAKFDLVRRKDGQIVIGEIKKSSKFEESATMQLAYYLLQLRDKGIDATGELMFPTEKRKKAVTLTPEIESKLQKSLDEIRRIMALPTPPPAQKIKYCGNCAYEEFCWS